MAGTVRCTTIMRLATEQRAPCYARTCKGPQATRLREPAGFSWNTRGNSLVLLLRRPAYLGKKLQFRFDQLLANGQILGDVLPVRLKIHPIVDEHKLSLLAREASVTFESDPIDFVQPERFRPLVAQKVHDAQEFGRRMADDDVHQSVAQLEMGDEIFASILTLPCFAVLFDAKTFTWKWGQRTKKKENC